MLWYVMKKSCILIKAILLCLSFFGTPAASYAQPGLQQVATQRVSGTPQFLPGGFRSEASGSNTDGSVVVGWIEHAELGSRAVRWTRDGDMEQLTLPEGYILSRAKAISASEEFIIGHVTASSFHNHAVRWSRSGDIEILPIPDGYIGSTARAISADGHYMAGGLLTPQFGYHAARWTAEGKVEIIPLPQGVSGTYESVGISDCGRVVTGILYQRVSDSGTIKQTFRWVEGEGTALLPLPSGITGAFASAINSDGTVIVGTAYYLDMALDGFETTSAFRWKQGEEMMIFMDKANAEGISADGKVVTGWGMIFDSELQGIVTRSFRLDMEEGLQVFQLPSSLSTKGVSADGRVLIGYGVTPARESRAFRMTVGDEIEKEVALRVSQDRRQIRADGESTIEISAILYEYIPDMSESSTPLAGKTLTFEIREVQGLRPGSLSAASAVTDENGSARVVYTAPEAEWLRMAESYSEDNITVRVRFEESDKEDLAYIRFLSDRGQVRVEPSMDGILGTVYGGTHGLVPPDGRFPARISILVEDDNFEPLTGEEVTFAIIGENTFGTLRTRDGIESKTVTVETDGRGNAVVHYHFASDRIPDEPVTETIQISSSRMTQAVEAKVSIGLNIVFDHLESAYEGRGVINAGEEIPLRIRITDLWNPGIDLSQIISYWGLGNETGNTRLYVQLEIDNISSIPDYLLDHMRQENYGEAPFIEKMDVRTFRDHGQWNMLWVPESSFKTYGYPRVRPVASGNHYYQARVLLVDQHGEEVFRSEYPTAKALFNLQTDMPADAVYIFFIKNPLRPQTKEAELLALALDVMGFGALVSVVDALEAINRGDSDALFSMLFSQITDRIMGQAKDRSPAFNEIMEAYGHISMAEKIDFEIRKGKTGPIATMEQHLFDALGTAFDHAKRTLVILSGDGSQRLLELPETDPYEIPSEIEIPAVDNSLYHDQERGVFSLRKGNISYYLIPSDMNVTYENMDEMKQF